MDIKKKMQDLVNIILQHNDAYYNNDNPVITDFEYDALVSELKEIERNYPYMILKNSPTQSVQGSAKFSPVTHEYKMESLQDVFSKEELYDFLAKTNASVGQSDYVVEYKIDGLSVNIIYDNGNLVRAATRGNGEVGEDVTENVKQIECIPHQISDKRKIIIRGEVYMKKSVFVKLNQARLEQNQQLLANPRNAAAGSLRQLDASVVKERELSFFCFNLENIRELGIKSHIDGLLFVKSLGLEISPTINKYTNLDEIIYEIESIGKNTENIDFEIDGAVVKIDDIVKRDILGSTSKFPKWACAFKYPAETKKTKLLDIVVTVGRTGALTPNAVLEPVSLAGTMVSRATLHNKDFIENLGICISDTVFVRKAGEIIPEIIGVAKENRQKDANPYKMPDVCPSCGHKVFYDENEVALRCINPACPAQIEENIIHFASKGAMNIEGLGPSIVKALVANKLIEDAADLYTINREELLKLERFGEKSVTNLINEIEKSKQNQLERVIFGLGIRHVGQKASKILANHFENIQNIEKASIDEITNIHEIGHKTAESLKSYLNSENIVEKLLKNGVNMTQMSTKVSDKFKDQTFVLTGTLSIYTRKEATDLIESFSGKVSSSVSKKTSYLVCGEDAGSKLDKANSLGVKVLTEEEFQRMILN